MNRSLDDDEAWIAVKRTDSIILRWLGNIAGAIGGRLLDFSLTYGDRYEIDLTYMYGADMIPADEDFDSWFDAAVEEVFNEIDKTEDTK